MAKNFLDGIRNALNTELENRKSDSNNTSDLEFVPEIGKTYKIRIIPGNYKFGKDKNLSLFYWMDSFHYMEGIEQGGKGPYVYSKPDYVVDGKSVMCPIDKTVKDMYDSKEKDLMAIAQRIKRKRHYKFNVILYEVDGDPVTPQYKILKDTSAQGKLAKLICDKLQIPFVADAIQTKPWIDKFEETKGKKAYDLLSQEGGHDFVIKRIKGRKIEIPGQKEPIYEVDYSPSFPYEEPRDLTDEDLKIAEEARDLATLTTYIEDFDAVAAILEEYTGKLGSKKESAPQASANKPAMKSPSVPPKQPTKADEDGVASEDDIIAQLRASSDGAKEDEG